MKPATLWQFVMKKDGPGEIWTWRHVAPDGSVLAVSTRNHPNYGEVVYDAIRHGFHPKQQPWCVTDNGGTRHFFPDTHPGAQAPRPPRQG